MDEVGVDISMHQSRHIDEFSGIDFDYVVKLCDNAFPKSAKIKK